VTKYVTKFPTVDSKIIQIGPNYLARNLA